MFCCCLLLILVFISQSLLCSVEVVVLNYFVSVGIVEMIMIGDMLPHDLNKCNHSLL